jgi:hypothetical protein
MSHFLLGLPVEIIGLASLARIVRPVTTPELGFKFEMAEPQEWFSRDVEKAVEAFMSIRTFEDALAVFSVYGPLIQEREFMSFEEVEVWVRGAWNVRTATLSDIIRWHKAKTSEEGAMEVVSAEDTLTMFSPNVQIELKDPPRLQFTVAKDIICALMIVLHLEKLQGIRHKYCALPDCRKPFELKGDKDRKFCSYDCSHKSAVRASRQRAKEAKSKKSSKRSTRG